MQSFDEHCSCVKESSLIENNQYRVGSEKYFEYFRDVREAYHAGELTVDPSEIDIIEGNLGEFSTFKGENVALDCIFEAEEKNPPLNKPKVGGAKKYYVYVKDGDKVKKVSWGDTTGLKVKLNDPAARKSFAARHDCANKKDKTKAGYWACNLPRYAKQLGLSGGGNFFW